MRYTPTCFFCYAWESEERFKILEVLRRSIIEKSNERVNVILDRHSYEDNEDFNILRERIRSYDLIVLFGTPDFKKIILDPDANSNKDREVLKEWKIIKERYQKDNNSVFPVILNGDKESSLLEEFSNRNARRIESFNISYNKKYKSLIVPDGKLLEYNIFISKIINTTVHNSYNRSEEYRTTQEALDNLFGLTDKAEIPNSCLVKPDLYNQIRGQRCYFVAGRKGSGKSTFIYNFREMDREYFDEHYKKLVPLRAEAFQHNNAYESLVLKHRADKTLLDTYSLLSLFWQIYFILHCIIIIRVEIEDHNIKTGDKRYYIFDQVTKRLMHMIGLKTRKQSYESVYDARVPEAIFNAAVELVDDHFQSALREITDGELILTSFAGKFTVKAIIEKAFGSKNIKEFIRALSKCKRKIMISLDGFDTHSEDFRSKTETMKTNVEEYNNRREYEQYFFRTLIEVVTKLKSHDTRDDVTSAFGEFIDFCIVLPKDRYDIIIENDRDSFKKKFGNLSWSGLELEELAAKRLEYLASTIDSSFKVNQTLNPTERLNTALAFFSGLPTSIEMKVNDNVIRMSLFNYILRASFWRPRDIISNLSIIMAQMVRKTEGRWKSDGNSLNEDDIKLSIKSNTEKIINEEFIGEYKHVFHNLDDVLRELQGSKEQMSIQEFMNILKGIRFDAMFDYDLNIPENKLRILYQLGVIGLLYSKQEAKRQHYLSHVCFEFNEGMTPLEDFFKHDKANISIIFNLIFTRRLMLQYNTDELIGNWSDDYMKSNHVNKEAIHGM